MPLFYLIATLLLLLGAVDANQKNHRYESNEPVQLWVNQVGPHNNPQETYGYYSLPYCDSKVNKHEKKFPSLGEALQGIELTKSNIEIRFRQNVAKRTLCSQTLDSKKVEQFSKAVMNNYVYQMFIDDLPMWGFVGGTAARGNDQIPFIYSHQHFSLGYNHDRVVEANITTSNKVPLQEGMPLVFSYSVQWHGSNLDYHNRFSPYLDNKFFEHKIHWFSIFNAFMMVVFLAGLVVLILIRTLRGDLTRYAQEADDDLLDETGWKQLHGDVFRTPNHVELLSAIIGTGCQLALLVFMIILLAIFHHFYDHPGSITTSFVICYALTAITSGYFSASYYMKLCNDNHWIRVMILTASLFPAISSLISFSLNFIAIGYLSLAAIPFGTMVVLAALWLFVSAPLVFGGTLLGRIQAKRSKEENFRVAPIPRPIPEVPWYRSGACFAILGGILPFGSIFIEMYFIFSSFWGFNKYYYVYGFMLLVYVILIIVTLCVAVATTYFLLSSEDWRWMWTSFLSGASTGLYVYLYAVYFFFSRPTKMSGLFQVSFYFGYTLLFCIGVGILCGTVSFVGAHLFVRAIYKRIKSD
eukprot:gb/GECH01012410.1/.p1 GENE.gb/GECH01012410.1/~~gb/GECH01012410.1/.p1  ORF type:complete len:582 (+),score=48.68 gb/GECH01012410.1/:1-1746(+)